MIRYFAIHPTAANLLMLMLVVLGLSVLPTLERETFPEFAPQEVQISVPYPGATPEDVEQAVCKRLEDAIDAVNEVDEIRCQALENSATAIATMTEQGDFARFMDDIKSAVEAIDSFPDQVELPVIEQLGRNDQVVNIAITGPLTPPALKAYADGIKDRLQMLPLVSQVILSGFSEHQLQIKVSAEMLRRHGLSISDLANTIARQNIDLPAGSIETREHNYLIRFMDQQGSLQGLDDLVIIGGGSGSEIRLGDIATIQDSFEMDEEKILFNGQRAALLQVNKAKTEDTLRVFEAVKAFVEREQQLAPPEIHFALTNDSSTVVRDRLQILTSNGLQGLVLVFLVMWLFFQVRFAFWVAMGLPVSFLGGLFIMSLLGQSINMISMVALLLSLGLLMDDAIVIAENIATHLRRGKSAFHAAIDGTRQVMPGVVSSFLTSVAVFAPLAFLSGNMGKVLEVIPVVLIAVLAVSLIEAFLILPHHLAHALKNHEADRQSRFRQHFDAFIEHLRHEVLGRAIDQVIQWRYLFIGLVLALFIASIGMLAGGHLKRIAFPDIDGDAFEARLLLPQGTPLPRTEAVVAEITAALERVNDHYAPLQPGGQRLIEDVTIRYNQNLDAGEKGTHLATISVDILGSESRVGRVDDYLQRWRDEVGQIPDVISLNFKEPQAGPAGIAIEIRLQGRDLQRLKAASMELQGWLRQYRGVINMSDDLRPGKPEIRLHLKDGSLAFGLDAATIANQLRAAFYGITADQVETESDSYEITVALTEPSQDSLDDLRNFRILTARGDQVPLSTVVDIELGRGYGRIQRVQGVRTVTITADMDTALGNANQVLAVTQRDFLPELQQRYPDVRFLLEGQAEESNKTSGSMVRGFLIGLVGIFVLLSFQFRSYIEPVAVMLTIPLAMIGVIWGHLLMGLDLSMPSIMGAVSLAGIVVNDSILLVEFLKLRAREGIPIPEAAKIASRERFRAVLLTSLTTVAGLTPLLMESSLQAQILTPLATSIVFGLLVATLLVLFVVPAIFSIFSDFGWVSVEKEQHVDEMD
ncbi:MAG: efflux RND transporter permease subunit [Candidatus Polarisedimenticolaceae bacterium]|nr:efflux RND transporter permease subunit [Candidatus Polarisedimenticolaceae bacterium]